MRPYHNGIVLHTLYFASEVREVAEYGKTENMTLQKPEIELAEQFIKQLTAGFAPEQYKDEYQDRVLALVETKRAGQVVAGQPQKAKLAPVIDLMEALKKSIAERGAPAPAAAAPTWSNPVGKKRQNQPQLQKASRHAAAKPVKHADDRARLTENNYSFLKSSFPQQTDGCPTPRLFFARCGIPQRCTGNFPSLLAKLHQGSRYPTSREKRARYGAPVLC